MSIRSNRTRFVFRPFRGRSTNGTLTVCDRRGGSAARAIIINNIGRPRLSAAASNGNPLSCPPG